MRIARIDTLRVAEFPNLLFVEVRTDEGLVGLGETFYGARAVDAYVHENIAPRLLGADPRDVEAHAGRMGEYLGYRGTGVESRGRSAVDVALWDLLGQACQLPLYRLLGGRTRDGVPIYNTCAGSGYVRQRTEQATHNWGLDASDGAGPRYEDLAGFLHRPAELAQSLLGEGIRAMKIWPFDPYAEASGGTYISAADLDRALEPIRKIRDVVGSEIEVMVELHGLWQGPAARRILAALQEYGVRWVEDPVRADQPQALAALSREFASPIAVGETVGGLADFAALMDAGAVDVVTADVAWCGGITALRKVAAVAEAHGLPVAPHDCTGPVALTASTHLSVSLPNAIMQETVRAFYRGWYRELVTALPPIADGRIFALEAPGLGTALRPEVREREDVTVRHSSREPEGAATAPPGPSRPLVA